MVMDCSPAVDSWGGFRDTGLEVMESGCSVLFHQSEMIVIPQFYCGKSKRRITHTV